MEVCSLAGLGIKAGYHDWKRSVWLIGGIMLGLAFFVAISSIGASYTELVRLPFSRIESDLLIQLGTKGKSQESKNESSIKLPFSNQAISKESVRAIAALEEVKKLDSAILLWHQEKKNFITITGIDPGTTGRGPAKVLQWISKGRTLQKSGETIIESHYARFHKLKPGDTIHFGKREFTIVGVSKIKEGASLAAANYYITIKDARDLAGMEEGAVNLLSASLATGTKKDVVQKKIASLIPGSIVSSTDSISEMMRGFARISSATSDLLSITALIFTIFFACWLIIGRQQEQRWQIGLMETLGWQKKDILVRSGAEIFTVAAIGSIAGVVLGILLSLAIGTMEVSITLPWNLSPDPEGMGGDHSLRSGNSMQVPLPVVLQPTVLFFGFAATCLTSVATGLWSSYRLSRQGIRKTLFEQ